MAEILERERATFESRRQEFLAKYKNMYVLLRGDEFIDAYFSRDDALFAGYKRFGAGDFVIKKVTESEEPASISSSLVQF